MKIVADTNVLLSGSFWDGKSRTIIDKAESGEITLVLSKDIINEFIRVLNYDEIKEKIITKNLEMKRTVEQIVSLSEIVIPTEKIMAVKNDPDDDIIIECALAGNVDFIISQDKDLIRLKEFRGIPIIKPEEFLEIIRNK